MDMHERLIHMCDPDEILSLCVEPHSIHLDGTQYAMAASRAAMLLIESDADYPSAMQATQTGKSIDTMIREWMDKPLRFWVRMRAIKDWACGESTPGVIHVDHKLFQPADDVVINRFFVAKALHCLPQTDADVEVRTGLCNDPIAMKGGGWWLFVAPLTLAPSEWMPRLMLRMTTSLHRPSTLFPRVPADV